MSPSVGVLALQGDFAAHLACLQAIGVHAKLVRTPEHLDCVHALVIPGGESSTLIRLLGESGLDALRRFSGAKAVLGTCAGAILLAAKVEPPGQPSVSAIDMTIKRNAYGRQIDSSIRTGTFAGASMEMVFIRAPRIVRLGSGVEVLATLDGEPVAVRQGLALAATFHPELSGDLRFHRLLLDVAHGG
jgi:5'-phosphate synthase pdxT subunit